MLQTVAILESEKINDQLIPFDMTKTNLVLLSSIPQAQYAISTFGLNLIIKDKKNIVSTKSQKSKLSTILFAGIMGSLIGITLSILPSPLNIMTSIALCGPLSVSLYALKK